LVGKERVAVLVSKLWLIGPVFAVVISGLIVFVGDSVFFVLKLLAKFFGVKAEGSCPHRLC